MSIFQDLFLKICACLRNQQNNTIGIFSTGIEGTAVILINSPVNRVPQLLIHLNSDFVAGPHKQINKESLMHFGNSFQIIHQKASESLFAAFGGNSDSSDMSMPTAFCLVAFYFAHHQVIGFLQQPWMLLVQFHKETQYYGHFIRYFAQKYVLNVSVIGSRLMLLQSSISNIENCLIVVIYLLIYNMQNHIYYFITCFLLSTFSNILFASFLSSIQFYVSEGSSSSSSISRSSLILVGLST